MGNVTESRSIILGSSPCQIVCFVLLFLGSFLVSEASWAKSWYDQLCYLRFGHEENHQVKAGTLDLSTLSADTYWDVRGEVWFFPGVLLAPHFYSDTEWSGLVSEMKAQLVPMSVSYQALDIKNSEHTFGTFVLRLRHAPKFPLLLRFDFKHHSSRNFLIVRDKVQDLGGLGQISTEPSLNKHYFGKSNQNYSLAFEDDAYLFTQVSSPKSDLAYSHFFIGYQDSIEPTLFIQDISHYLIDGMFLIIFVYYILLFFFRSHDLSSLYVALFSLLSFSFMIANLWPNTPGLTIIKVFTLLNMACNACIFLYLIDKIYRLTGQHVYRIWLFATLLNLLLGSILYSIEPSWANGPFAINFLNVIVLFSVTFYISAQYRMPGLEFLLPALLISMIFQFDIFRIVAMGQNEDNGFRVLHANLVLTVAFGLINAKEFALTFRRSLEQDILNQKLLADLKEQEKSRTLFFHNTSHELRTPLNGIIGFLDLLRQERYGAIPPQAVQQIEKALRLAESLKIQVNTILDLAKSKRGELKKINQKFSLQDLLEEANYLAEGLCLKALDLSYTSTLEANDLQFVGDREKIFAILRNLLGNAFKFRSSNRPNSVKLLIAFTENELRIEVSDTGIGIPDAFKQRIFEEFGQVQADSRRSYEGTGLGLSMVRDFVRLLEGQIKLSTELDVGSTFVVRIPAGSDNDLDLTTASISTQFEMHEPKNRNLKEVKNLKLTKDSHVSELSHEQWMIFVIDDNETNCEVITDMLSVDGYNLDYSISARVGLERMRKSLPHVLLLDMMMPEMSGEDVISEMRKDPVLCDIPIIVITARASDEDRVFGLKLGADDYLAKPIFADELRLRVRNRLDRQRLLRLSEKAAQQDKIAQFGELFRDLSHELKNIMQGAAILEDLKLDDGLKAVAVLSLSESQQIALGKLLIAQGDGSPSGIMPDLLPLPETKDNARLMRHLRQVFSSLPAPQVQLLSLWNDLRSLPVEELEYIDSQLKVFVQYRVLLRQLQLCHELTRNVLQYSRSSSDKNSGLVSEAWRLALALMQARLRKYPVSIQSNLQEVEIAVPTVALTQVFLNLLINALDAMQEAQIADPWIQVTSHILGNEISIQVRNSGEKIPESIHTKLFERGFSTKGDAGNGIGLFASRRLLREGQGDLWYNPDGAGVCFEVQVNLAKAKE